MKIGPFEILIRKADTKSHDDFWTHDDVLMGGTLPRSSFAWGRELRGGLDSNVIMSPVSWIMRTFTEAEPIVQGKREGAWRRVDEHPLETLLARPNPFYDGDACTKALVISYCLDGNAYKIKIRNPFGEVIQLWYAPHWMIEPKWPDDNSEFISHYEYSPGNGEKINLSTRDVVHIRFGLDPRNPRKGFSPLRPLLREIFTDEEASNFAAAVLRNQGFPGLLISPKDTTRGHTTEQAKELKAKFQSHFTGDRRGEPFVATQPTDIKSFGFDAQQINLTGLRDISEERVCAMLGLPAAVVGFGAGLQQTKVGATMRELVRLARVNVVNPMARSFGKTLTIQLLPDFASQLKRFRVRYDMSEVSVFQEDETETQERIIAAVQGGIMRVDKAQEAIGLDVDESQKIYLRDSSKLAVPANRQLPSPPANRLNGGTPDEADEGAIEENALM